MSKKNKKTEVTGIVYFCSNLQKEIIIRDLQHLSAPTEYCEICGSHGSINLWVFNCECGKNHDIEIKKW